MPDAGGYDDQDASKMDDLYALLARYDYHFRRLKPIASGEQKEEEPPDLSAYYTDIYK